MIDYVALGQRILIRRMAMQLTQKQLAELAGISASYLGRIERGRRAPSVETLIALCNALAVRPTELLPPQEE